MTAVDAAGRGATIVVVGAGKAGHQHAEAACRAGLRVVAYVDPDPRAGIEGLPRIELGEAVGSPSVDALAFCVPPAMRGEHLATACRAGKAVVVEKPPAPDLVTLDELLTSIPPQNVPLVMLQNRLLLAGQPEAPRLGSARGFVHVSRPRPAHHWSGWRADRRASGGGVVAHLGIHYLDLALLFLGRVVDVDVTSRTEAAPGVDVELEAIARFAGGSTIDVRVTSLDSSSRQEIALESAVGEVRMHDGRLSWRAKGGDHHVVPRSAADLRTELYRTLAARIAGTTPPELYLLSSTRETQRLLDSLYTADVRGGPSCESRPGSPPIRYPA